MRKIILFSMLLSLHLTAFCVPALRTRCKVLLTDGTYVMATYQGDEYHSWLLDDEGFVLERVGDTKTYIRTQRRAADEQTTANSRRSAAARHIGSAATAPLPHLGSPKVPVLLVEFQDSTFQVADTPEGVREYYNAFCNGRPDRTTVGNNYGSIRDYFSEQSGGLFTPEFVIIGPVRLPQKASYYGQDDSYGNKDIVYAQFKKDAILAATEYYGGEWSDFDNKGKGQVDMIFFLFAGCGDNTAHQGYLLWPKESTASSTVEFKKDGQTVSIKFATTGCTSENRANLNEDGIVTSVKPDGVGVFCHELSHALGLPDFYDINYKAFGMDLWSVMDYGCYAANGYIPGGYNTYELDFMGWRELPVITDSGTYTLQPVNQGGSGVKIVNSENPNEYYVLENRQREGWDQAICRYSSGMLAIHVDFDKTAWNNNRVNTNASHQRMTIIPANNRYIGTTATSDGTEIVKTWAGNLYPFEGNDSITRNSTPAASVFTSSGYMGQDVNRIRINSNKSVSFYFGNDYQTGIEAPQHDNGQQHSSDCEHNPQWSTIDGRRLQTRPMAPGIYVMGGKKIAVQ